jgi:predicted site-specific integrase-resolvase
MSSAEPSKTRPLNPTRVMAEQHRVSIRTIERWTDAGILPQPERINGRKYWPDGTTPKFDRGHE